MWLSVQDPQGDQPDVQSSDQSNGHSLYQSKRLSADQTQISSTILNQLLNAPINQTINETLHQSNNQSNNQPTNQLSLEWCFGFDAPKLSFIHSLTTINSHSIFYTSGHVGVIHMFDRDYRSVNPSNTQANAFDRDCQLLLIGHTNDISAVAVSKDKKWIVTADCGSNNQSIDQSNSQSLIIVWNAQTGDSVRVIECDQSSIQSIDLSHDGLYIAAVRLSNDQSDNQTINQTLCIYERIQPVTQSNNHPVATCVVNQPKPVHCIRWHPESNNQLIGTTHQSVTFFHWKFDQTNTFNRSIHQPISQSIPSLGDAKLKGVGSFNQSILIVRSNRAVTVTSSGHILVWDFPPNSRPINQSINQSTQSIDQSVDPSELLDTQRMCVKLLKLVKAGINVIVPVRQSFSQSLSQSNNQSANQLAFGCSDGIVRLFDCQFRLVRWFEGIGYGDGSINSISFDDLPTINQTMNQSLNQSLNASLNGTAPVITNQSLDQSPPFIIATNKGKIIALRGEQSINQTIKPNNQSPVGRLLLSSFDAPITNLSSHPTLPIFVVAINDSITGSISVWDLDERRLIGSRNFTIGQKSPIKQSIKQSSKQPNNHSHDQTARPEEEEKTMVVSPVTSSPKKSINQANNLVEMITNQSINQTAICFDPRGSMIAIGFDNGFIRLIDCSSIQSSNQSSQSSQVNNFLADIASFHQSSHLITQIVWSHDSTYFATIDSGCYVSLFYNQATNQTVNQTINHVDDWVFIGRNKAHYGKIVDIIFDQSIKQSFNQSNASNSSAAKPQSTSSNNQFLYRLYSLGSDGRLIEYDLANSSIKSGLRIRSSNQAINHTINLDGSQPTAMCRCSGREMNQSINQSDDQSDAQSNSQFRVVTDEAELLLIATDQYKILIYEMVDLSITQSFGRQSLVLRKTVLAPTFGEPINKMILLPNKQPIDQSNNQTINQSTVNQLSSHLLFSCRHFHLGLFRLPLTGRYDQANSVLAHPSVIQSIKQSNKQSNKSATLQTIKFASSFDGQYSLSVAEGDHSIKVWKINQSINQTIDHSNIHPFLELLDDTLASDQSIDQPLSDAINQSVIIQDLIDLFYLTQLTADDSINQSNPSSHASRQLTGRIPISQSINLCCALGFYPAATECQAIMEELRDENRLISNAVDTCSLDQFVRMFVNHRPVIGMANDTFDKAFQTINQSINQSDDQVPTELLVSAVMSAGSGLTEDQVTEYLDELLGAGGVYQTDEQPCQSISQLNEREDMTPELKAILLRLPATMSPKQFAENVLGFETSEELAE